MSKTYRKIEDCLDTNTQLRIIPTSHFELKDKLFILQLHTDRFDSKQMYVSKNDIDHIIDELKRIKKDWFAS